MHDTISFINSSLVTIAFAINYTVWTYKTEMKGCLKEQVKLHLMFY